MDEDVKVKLIASISGLVFILLLGTALFHNLEGWTWVDSFYFTGITVTTVGYGDIHPTHDLSKILTVLFSFVGVGIALFAITSIAQEYFEDREERMVRKIRNFHFSKKALSSLLTTKSQSKKNLGKELERELEKELEKEVKKEVKKELNKVKKN